MRQGEHLPRSAVRQGSISHAQPCGRKASPTLSRAAGEHLPRSALRQGSISHAQPCGRGASPTLSLAADEHLPRSALRQGSQNWPHPSKYASPVNTPSPVNMPSFSIAVPAIRAQSQGTRPAGGSTNTSPGTRLASGTHTEGSRKT